MIRWHFFLDLTICPRYPNENENFSREKKSNHTGSIIKDVKSEIVKLPQLLRDENAIKFEILITKLAEKIDSTEFYDWVSKDIQLLSYLIKKKKN